MTEPCRRSMPSNIPVWAVAVAGSVATIPRPRRRIRRQFQHRSLRMCFDEVVYFVDSVQFGVPEGLCRRAECRRAARLLLPLCDGAKERVWLRAGCRRATAAACIPNRQKTDGLPLTSPRAQAKVPRYCVRMALRPCRKSRGRVASIVCRLPRNKRCRRCRHTIWAMCIPSGEAEWRPAVRCIATGRAQAQGRFRKEKIQTCHAGGAVRK